MNARVVRRALAAGLSISVTAAGLVAADVLEPAGDVIVPGGTTLTLGNVAPGQVVIRDIPLRLRCSSATHVARGTTVTVTQGATDVQGDGTITVSSGSVGPVPGTWPLTGETCPGADLVLAGSTLRVTVVAPAVPGSYEFLAILDRSPTSGVNAPAIVASFTVAGNTPPVISVPVDFVAEGDTSGGWAAAYTATASDAEDDPDPAAACLPSPGTVLPLGATTVTCSATDIGGLVGAASFTVTVQDTTPPALTGVPSAIVLETHDAAGVAATWPTPTATDDVDAGPTVGCVPSSGSWFGIGTRAVQCTARDATGNAASTSFSVTIVRRAVLTARWDEPVGGAPSMAVHRGRTLPLKVSVAVDGAAVDGAAAAVRLVADRLDACGGSAVERLDRGPFARDGGRWATHLDTSLLATGCWRVVVDVDGVIGGGFELRVVDGAVGSGPNTAKPGRSGR